MKKLLTWLAIILGIVCLGLAGLYWTTSAGNLPAFLPGYLAGSSVVHFKHGLAALIVAVLLFIFAWFNSGPKRQPSSMSESTPTTTQ